MIRLGYGLLATVVIALLAAITRKLFFERARGYMRALGPVALAWLVGAPLGIWSESTDQSPPDWWRVVLTYTVPAAVVGAVYWLRERRTRRDSPLPPAPRV